jgi:hypothetical protein
MVYLLIWVHQRLTPLVSPENLKSIGLHWIVYSLLNDLNLDSAHMTQPKGARYSVSRRVSRVCVGAELSSLILYAAHAVIDPTAALSKASSGLPLTCRACLALPAWHDSALRYRFVTGQLAPEGSRTWPLRSWTPFQFEPSPLREHAARKLFSSPQFTLSPHWAVRSGKLYENEVEISSPMWLKPSPLSLPGELSPFT